MSEAMNSSSVGGGTFYPPAPAVPSGIGALATALAKAQAGMVNPPRNREVEVKTKSGGSYKFKYATLDAIIDAIRKPLTDNGLWFTQTLENGDGKYRLVTTLLHSSGQSLRSETPLLLQDAGNQAFGSALTYMRRYALTAMLGVAADEDDDGNAADGNEAKVKQGTSAAISGPIGQLGPKNDQVESLSLEWFDTSGAQTRKIRGAEAYLTELYDAVKNVTGMFDSNEHTLAWLEREYGTAKVGKKGKSVAQAAKDIRLLYDAKTGAHV
jgi:hypothetical protein